MRAIPARASDAGSSDTQSDLPTAAREIAARARGVIAGSLETHLDRLKGLVAIPSVSVDADRADDVRRSAVAVRDLLLASGAESAELHETAGHPLVLGRFRARTAGETNARTSRLLVYVHHDVQPVGEVEEWDSLPFEATRSGDVLTGRGTADDKGPIVEWLAAIEALSQSGDLPVEIVMIVDGEEEIGSPSLPGWLAENRALLDVDLCVISDTSMLSVERPSVVVGTRGVVTLEVEVRTLEHDVHSGKFGGVVANAALVLASLLASLHDASGHVAIDGFYDDVRELSRGEAEELKQAAPPLKEWLAAARACAEGGERDRGVGERAWARPTLEVCGLQSGYAGPGTKTIIPATASAKLSCRLVPDQDPERVVELVASHLRTQAAGRCELTLRPGHGGRAVMTDPNSAAIAQARRAYAWGYGTEPVLIREGGSIPVAEQLAAGLGRPLLFLGFGIHAQNEHAPNEWLSVRNFESAANSIVMFLLLAAENARS